MRDNNIPASFFVPAVVAKLHPNEQRQLVSEGHEIGIHGWIHELNSSLPEQDERELMLRAADVLEEISGFRPVGMRTPVGISRKTLFLYAGKWPYFTIHL